MSRRLILLASLLLGSLTILAFGADLPIGPMALDAMGVNIHFTDPKPGELEQIYAAGFRWTRMDFGWAGIEREPGQYDFAEYDRLLAALEKNHLHAYFILDYSNSHYDDNLSPHTDVGRAAFARFAAAAVQHFKGHGILWEMYNEPNIFFWKPKPDANDYAKLALAVGKAIHDAAPDEAYIGPATSGIDLPFIETCLKAGCLDYWSAVSVHPYRRHDPETVADDYRALRLLLARYSHGRDVPIISGEWGYSSAWEGFDEQRQAKYLPRELLTNLAEDVKLSIWYDWHEDGQDPKEDEHHFGTVRFPEHPGAAQLYEPKPAYLAMKKLGEALSGRRFSKRLWVGDESNWILLFNGGEKPLVAAWTTEFKPEKQSTLAEEGLSLEESVCFAQSSSEWARAALAWGRAPHHQVVLGPDVVAVETKIVNPLDQALLIEAAQTPTLPPPVKIKPGEAATVRAEALISRSDQPQLIDSIIRPERGRYLQQRTQIIVGNWVRLVPLPPAKSGRSVYLENPSGFRLHGNATLFLSMPDVEQPTNNSSKTNGAPKPVFDNPPHFVDRAVAQVPVDLDTDETSRRISFSIPPDPRAVAFYVDIRDQGNNPIVTSHLFGNDASVPLGGVLEAWKLVPDGDPKVHADLALSCDSPPHDSLAPNLDASTFKITYAFDPGWKFFSLNPAESLPIKQNAAAIGIWVYGDASGMLARLRVADQTGQTHQAEGFPIDFKGWRYLRFPLDAAHLSHWGGANDGSLHAPLRIETLFLLDNPSREKRAGTIYLSAPMVEN